MATVSSHILDSVTGQSAVGIRVELVCISSEGNRQTVFDILSDKEGRISELVDAQDSEYELIFHLADYFPVDQPSVAHVVIRFAMHNNDKRYHMPVMLSPHSYSTWWSD